MLDVLIVTDMRFSGGTANAILADVAAFRDMGAHIGILPVTSQFFDGAPDLPNAKLYALADNSQVEILDTSAAISAKVVFFHHPLAFYHDVAERVAIKADTCVLVAHHPPFRGDGSLEYDPIDTNRTVQSAFGCTPIWAPVSGAIRCHLRSFTPLIRMTGDDWVNSFDAMDWKSKRPAFSSPTPCVGRHSRADMLKWSDQADIISQPLGAGLDGWRTRVMGCPTDDLNRLGIDTCHWDILDFNAEPVDVFLDSLDVFSYFYNVQWIEAFGRTIAEAILMERPCVLDPRLQPTFGSLAIYAKPLEVPACLQRLHEDAKRTRLNVRDARTSFLATYSVTAVANRYARLQSDLGSPSRKGPKFASPLTTVRKMIGLRRRTGNHQSVVKTT